MFSRGYDPSYEEQDHGRIAPNDLELRPKSVGRGTSGGDVGMSVAAMKRNHPEIREFLRSQFGRPVDRKLTLTEAEVLQGVQNDTLIGIVECDNHAPDPLKAHLSEMPPIFKNTGDFP